MKFAGLKILLLFLFFSSGLIYAQADSLRQSEKLLETYLEESTEGNENAALYDLLEDLHNNPININTASLEDLMKIPFLDYESAKMIIDYREKEDKFFSVNQLNLIKGFDRETAAKLKPFIIVKEPTIETAPKKQRGIPLSLLRVDFRSRALYDLQERSGFIEDAYLGSRYKTYNRLKASYAKKYRMAFLAEMDAGETSLVDHYTFYAEGNNIGFQNKILIGDYSFEFGQGLVIWSPYAFSKGSDAINPVTRRARNIVGFSSAEENRFFRGGAASGTFGAFRISAFFSNHNLDANIDSAGQITSLPPDGFHRTERELAKKDAVNEISFGGRIDYTYKNKLVIGALVFHSKYDKEFKPRDLFDLKGKEFTFYSLSYKGYFDKFSVIGETAYNGNSLATINTLQFNVTKKFIFLVSVRNYPESFFTLYANGFGEHGNTINEFGIYTGLRWRTGYGNVDFYFDQFKFPFAGTSIPLPSSGNEWLVNYTYKFSRSVSIRARYKNEKKEAFEIFNESDLIVEQLKQSIRIDLNFEPSNFLYSKTRIEYLYLLKDQIGERENGFLIYQDLRYRATRALSFYGRIIFFSTDSYASRLYEFENDLTGIMNNPALFGNGVRVYLLARYKIWDQFGISFKYAETYKPNETEISSALQQIEGNIDNKISLQIDLRF
ncbi:MAG: helix-hairpin-helix domain-containing protein [Chlorobi bacterium]|nr:helix-hairpin-helix domain-containing protein [Chlorobiota bacterium]